MPKYRPLDKTFESFYMVHVDLFYLPQEEDQRAILLIVDAATKWVEAFPISDGRSQTVWSKFEQEFIWRYGCPLVVVSDNGPEFVETFHE